MKCITESVKTGIPPLSGPSKPAASIARISRFRKAVRQQLRLLERGKKTGTYSFGANYLRTYVLICKDIKPKLI